ncbi:MAG: metal ABC transporter substrate-binding protein [bacterium]
MVFTVSLARAAPGLKLTATIFPLADIAKQVGGEAVKTEFILPPGADPHIFEPTPRQLVNIHETDILLKVGFGFESWLNKLLQSGKPSITLVAGGEASLLESGYQGDAGNPHVWLDPLVVVDLVKRLERAFISLDQGHSREYQDRAQNYIGRLLHTDRKLKQTFTGLNSRPFIVFHSAWFYWFRRYSLAPAAVVEEFPGQPVSSKKLIELVKVIRKKKIKTIFVNIQRSPKMAGVLAAETGAGLSYLDPQGGPGIKGRSSYLELLNYNGRIFREGLR